MRISLVLIILLLSLNTFAQNIFLNNQKKYERVRNALENKQSIINQNLKSNSLIINELSIIIIAFKSEGILELYAKNRKDIQYKKIKAYTICEKSGILGPKRQAGDRQVPEGFYHIDRFNPVSDYYLSLGINYPNNSDKIKSKAKDLGGDIFIHGKCVTIGCLPMTDNYIEEIYLYALFAKNNGQAKIPVYVFPFRMTDKNIENNKKSFVENPGIKDFWANLKIAYDIFEKEKKILNLSIAKNGFYTFGK